MADSDAIEMLSALRARIDAIDEEMHRLLIERGSVVDSLIAAKGTSASGVAFRPQREADMMRRLVARHSGNLPLATVEHLWREIITTFTYMQAPFRVVVDYGSDAAAMRDLARFAFGFSVELVPAPSSEDVVSTVASTGSDLGLIPIGDGRAPTPWWRGLSAEGGPRVMALWPFIAGKRTLSDIQAIVVAPPLSEPAAPDFKLYAASLDQSSTDLPDDLAIIAECATPQSRELLVAVPEGRTELTDSLDNIVEVGGIARGLRPAGSGEDALRQPFAEVRR